MPTLVPDNIIAAVNALLAPYGEAFTPVSPKQTEPTGGFLSIKDAAKYIGISRPGIYRKIRAGEISVHKLGEHRNCRVVIARSELDRYVMSHSV